MQWNIWVKITNGIGALHVAITAYVVPNEAVKKDSESYNCYCWPNIFTTKTPDLAPNVQHVPSGTHRDNITVISSIRSIVVPTWLWSTESRILSLQAILYRILSAA